MDEGIDQADGDEQGEYPSRADLLVCEFLADGAARGRWLWEKEQLRLQLQGAHEALAAVARRLKSHTVEAVFEEGHSGVSYLAITLPKGAHINGNAYAKVVRFDVATNGSWTGVEVGDNGQGRFFNWPLIWTPVGGGRWLSPDPDHDAETVLMAAVLAEVRGAIEARPRPYLLAADKAILVEILDVARSALALLNAPRKEG